MDQFEITMESAIWTNLARLADKRAVEQTSEGYRLSKQGILLGNEVFASFLSLRQPILQMLVNYTYYCIFIHESTSETAESRRALAWLLCIFIAIGGWRKREYINYSVSKKSFDGDIEKLYEIIQGYAEQGIMLPRSREMLQEQIDTFVVAELDGLLIGCGSLTRLGPDLVEIRSLGMTPWLQRTRNRR